MTEQPLDRSVLAKFAGLLLGILIGGPLGPMVFGVTGLSDPSAATAGSLIGAVLGYGIVSMVLAARDRRRDRELLHAANGVKDEAHLPATVWIRVDHGRLILEGLVEEDAERRRAKGAMETIPGLKAVINRVRVRTPSGNATDGNANNEISKEIEKRLLQAAEGDARGIQVVVNESRVVLEGSVRSWAEASAAEEAAWGFPGVTEVVNRLQIAAA